MGAMLCGHGWLTWWPARNVNRARSVRATNVKLPSLRASKLNAESALGSCGPNGLVGRTSLKESRAKFWTSLRFGLNLVGKPASPDAQIRDNYARPLA